MDPGLLSALAASFATPTPIDDIVIGALALGALLLDGLKYLPPKIRLPIEVFLNTWNRLGVPMNNESTPPPLEPPVAPPITNEPPDVVGGGTISLDVTNVVVTSAGSYIVEPITTQISYTTQDASEGTGLSTTSIPFFDPSNQGEPIQMSGLGLMSGVSSSYCPPTMCIPTSSSNLTPPPNNTGNPDLDLDINIPWWAIAGLLLYETRWKIHEVGDGPG
jgi:hypothetical protein